MKKNRTGPGWYPKAICECGHRHIDHTMRAGCDRCKCRVFLLSHWLEDPKLKVLKKEDD